MQLIHYLNDHFFTKAQLLEVSKVSEKDFQTYQDQQWMPQASYTLTLDVKCESFFGAHQESQPLEYYAKGYSSWLGILKTVSCEEEVYAQFASRYKSTLEQLNQTGHSSASPKVNADIDAHIQDEWGHFLDGTYGLCTITGLPEDIAAKELAILEINEIAEAEQPSQSALARLENAVNLLDTVSSLFAPHERLRSSRHRLVDEVRLKYQLSLPSR